MEGSRGKGSKVSGRKRMVLRTRVGGKEGKGLGDRKIVKGEGRLGKEE